MKKFIWVIDDHQLFNAGISRLLINLNGIDEVLSFSSPQEVFDAQKLVAPRLILADYFIPSFDVTEWMPKLNDLYSGSPMVVVSSSISTLDRKRALELGAIAYFEKHLEPDVVLMCLQQVLDDSYDTSKNSSSVIKEFANYNLTERQLDVLTCLARGHSLKLIALELGVSNETVKTHLSNLYRNINVSSKHDAICWARERGLI